jgi:flagellar protein FliO/FliZ
MIGQRVRQVMENTTSVENQVYAPESAQIQTQIQEAFSWAGLISTVVLFIIILLIILWLVQKINRKGFQRIQTPWIRVLDRQSLSPQQNVYLVEVAGKIQIWGSTDHQINQISEIDDPDHVSNILQEIAQRPEDSVDKLMKFLPHRRNRDLGQTHDFNQIKELNQTKTLSQMEEFSQMKGFDQMKGFSQANEINSLMKFSNLKDLSIRPKDFFSQLKESSLFKNIFLMKDSNQQKSTKSYRQTNKQNRKKTDSFSSELKKLMQDDSTY